MTTEEVLADELVVLPNRNAELVPNIGIIGGRDAVLVVDTGMGPRNAEPVLEFATGFARGRELFLTTTHFHPDHAFGAQVFRGHATYLVNRAQAEDLAHRGAGYLEMFRGLGPSIAAQLDGVEIPVPDVVYEHGHTLDLGGREVRLRATGRAHSAGDQVVTVPDAGTMFTGDLVETGQFAIFPWFPPHDVAVSGTRWIGVVEGLIEEAPARVVPGHGDVGGGELLTEVRDYLHVLRDETWRRRDAGLPDDQIVAEVRELMITRRPDWRGREWIDTAVACFLAEHSG
ncbi:MBL fold metallo-hydrolase [Amycolatopsis albispora]|uniref:MBL fold metallo-hydrolase n=1 Tax=Amycolatopsis albispora TaxID=1804986 RepID=A0A344LIU6_9PSEU|nr:MBL fold metallo-hydrolase [Amycolatopsis albispora]AXB47970.1 MBL fold metallo-hydrolase [Amycolatopsis albispora]